MVIYHDLTNIIDYEKLCFEEDASEPDCVRLKLVTRALIQLSEITGISKITNNNYKELTKRLAELQILGITYSSEPNPGDQDVKDHIGLKTNVDYCDNKKWANRKNNILRQQAEALIEIRNQEMPV